MAVTDAVVELISSMEICCTLVDHTVSGRSHRSTFEAGAFVMEDGKDIQIRITVVGQQQVI